MNNIKHVRETIDYLLDVYEDIGHKVRLDSVYKYIGDYYRINAEVDRDKNKVVLNVLKSYPDIEIQIKIDEISEEYTRHITRDSIHYLKEWSYRYGSKGRSVENMALPDTGDITDSTDQIVDQLNSRIKNTELSVNDVSLALKLSHIILKNTSSDGNIKETESYKQVIKLLEIVEDFINMKQPDIDWDLLAGMFNLIEQNTQEDIRENLGEKNIIRELREFDGDSIEKYLKQKNIRA